MTDTNYYRVIPRDLFNEAKLLKCMGHLCLKIHDRQVPIQMKILEEDELSNFKIGLMEEGSLTITNLIITLRTCKGKTRFRV